MSFRKDYKIISSFYKSGNEDIQTSCLHDFKRRVENSDSDIRNIGDINKINVTNNSNENFEINNFQTANHRMNSYNLKTPIDSIENKTDVNNFQNTNHKMNSYDLKTPIDHIQNKTDVNNFHNPNHKMNSYDLKTPIDRIENKTIIDNFHGIKHEPSNYLNMENYTTRHKNNNENFEMTYTQRKYKNTSAPDVFGPPLWFTLHNGASKYPHNPGNLVKQRMKYFILGIPVMIPCARCREDATAYIEKFKDSLDDICSSRLKLFEFFFTFHNVVNKKLNKPIMKYEEAIKLYSDDVQVNKLSF
jgi:hypothetical protein